MATSPTLADTVSRLPDDNTLLAVLHGLLRGERPTFPLEGGPVYGAWRRRGRLLRAGWFAVANLPDLLTEPGADTLELCFSEDYQPVTDPKRQLANVHRGRWGLEIRCGAHWECHAPGAMLASNRGFQRVIERFRERHGLDEATFQAQGGHLRRFRGRQFLVRLGSAPTATPLYRGKGVVSLRDVGPDLVQTMITDLGGWLHRHLADDGGLPYKYWPSRGEYSRADNTIRQFMATVALIRYARWSGNSGDMAHARRNLDHNLQRFFRWHRGVGVIHWDGSAKLGAAALAALAILELPDNDAYRPVYDLLCRGIDRLWQNNGAFKSFHYPPEREWDNQNFYPGEALVFWAERFVQEQNHDLFAQTLLSFGYYRDWHRRQPNPAFIPWHTQALARLYQQSGYEPLRDFVFAMNDGLLDLQQTDSAPDPDLRGRFYDPAHPEYGPPHASSTGVYLEGLAAAYELALAEEDGARIDRYREAIREGIRNLRQLQFVDDTDTVYLEKPEAVRGAIHTEVYDNTVRIDNVQHALMALLRLAKLPGFQAEASPVSDEWRYFRKLATVDTAPLLAEVQANTALWEHSTGRQRKIKVQRETHNIPLRAACKPIPEGVSANDHHLSEPTALAGQFPRIMAFVEGVARDLGGSLGRVNVVRLTPRGQVYRHIDHGEYYRRRDRYHLILQSPSGSVLEAGGEEVRMQEGELWWFDNKQPHEAHNEADDWRIHIIFDVEPGSSASAGAA